jgi:hypothetical protein
MNRVAIALAIAVLSAAVGGCASSKPVEVKLTGTPGAKVNGYYVQNGRRVPLDATLPVTLDTPGITLVAVRKADAATVLNAEAKAVDGSSSMSMGMPAGKAGGIRLETGNSWSCDAIDPGESLEPPKPGDAVMTIEPYWHENTWVFDDPQVGLEKEPFVEGIPEMITELAKDVPNARDGFRLSFSAKPFPGHQMTIDWVRAQGGGNVYRLHGTKSEGWICPALFRYYRQAPKHFYLRADPKAAG